MSQGAIYGTSQLNKDPKSILTDTAVAALTNAPRVGATLDAMRVARNVRPFAHPDFGVAYTRRQGADAGELDRLEAFKDRFSMREFFNKTEDMQETLRNPANRLALISQEIETVAFFLAREYKEVFDRYIASGVDRLKAYKLVDDYILKKLDSEVLRLQEIYPYSFKATGAINQLIRRQEQISNPAQIGVNF